MPTEWVGEPGPELYRRTPECAPRLPQREPGTLESSRDREDEMIEQENDGRLPCSECGRRVRPGRHSLAECTRNQIEDAEKTESRTEEDNDGE